MGSIVVAGGSAIDVGKHFLVVFVFVFASLSASLRFHMQEKRKERRKRFKRQDIMNKNAKYKASTKSVIRLSSRHCKIFVLTASSLQGLQLFRAILWHVLARRTFPVHRPIWSLAALVCAGGRYIGHRKRLPDPSVASDESICLVHATLLSRHISICGPLLGKPSF